MIDGKFVVTIECVRALRCMRGSTFDLFMVLLENCQGMTDYILECNQSHARLAKLLGIKSSADVSRSLRLLKERGIVSTDGHKSIVFNPRMVRCSAITHDFQFKKAFSTYDDIYVASLFHRKKVAGVLTKTEKKNFLDIAERSGGEEREYDPFEYQENEDVAVQEEESISPSMRVSTRLIARDLRTLGMFGPEDDSGAEDACGRAAGGGLSLAGEGPQGGD